MVVREVKKGIQCHLYNKNWHFNSRSQLCRQGHISEKSSASLLIYRYCQGRVPMALNLNFLADRRPMLTVCFL